MNFSVIDDHESERFSETPTIMKVFGCGGCGCNAVNRLTKANVPGVELIAMNTDMQSLNHTRADKKIPLGMSITEGRGAGGDPEKGKEAAEESIEAVKNILKESNMNFIVAGMGGGTGTGSAPVVAKASREAEALTLAVVTMPFAHEGTANMELAKAGLRELKKSADAVIVVPNTELKNCIGDDKTMEEVFDFADEVLSMAIRGISGIITGYGTINVDFADVKRVLEDSGNVLLGIGSAKGKGKGLEAAEQAINHPLFKGMDIRGAQRMLVVVAGKNIAMDDFLSIKEFFMEKTLENMPIVSGLYDSGTDDVINVTVIAAGFGRKNTNDMFAETKTAKSEPGRENTARPGDGGLEYGNEPNKNTVSYEEWLDIKRQRGLGPGMPPAEAKSDSSHKPKLPGDYARPTYLRRNNYE